MSRQVALQALMASKDMPDVEALLDELVNRPGGSSDAGPWREVQPGITLKT